MKFVLELNETSWMLQLTQYKSHNVKTQLFYSWMKKTSEELTSAYFKERKNYTSLKVLIFNIQ